LNSSRCKNFLAAYNCHLYSRFEKNTSTEKDIDGIYDFHKSGFSVGDRNKDSKRAHRKREKPQKN